MVAQCDQRPANLSPKKRQWITIRVSTLQAVQFDDYALLYRLIHPSVCTRQLSYDRQRFLEHCNRLVEDSSNGTLSVGFNNPVVRGFAPGQAVHSASYSEYGTYGTLYVIDFEEGCNAKEGVVKVLLSLRGGCRNIKGRIWQVLYRFIESFDDANSHLPNVKVRDLTRLEI